MGAGDWDTTEGKQLGSDLSTRVLARVDVKIGQPVFDSCDQRRLGLLEPALEHDEGRIVERRVLQTKDWGEIRTLGHSQRDAKFDAAASKMRGPGVLGVVSVGRGAVSKREPRAMYSRCSGPWIEPPPIWRYGRLTNL